MIAPSIRSASWVSSAAPVWVSRAAATRNALREPRSAVAVPALVSRLEARRPPGPRERAVSGFGKISAVSNVAPDGKTIFRIGSVTKAFTGAILMIDGEKGSPILCDRGGLLG